MTMLILLLFCALGFLLIKLLIKPIGWALKLLFHALIGFAALFVLNFFGSVIGISLDLTWFNAFITGLLGLPGVVLLLAAQYFGFF